ncbi:hypothetical protein EV421DRAFT_1742112 [Armillaria borealis]|uniref:Endonuclease/exonuclease/phosphatase domain-containing protein n=1 Tax=Armillaria borealis TaxID=47425 RepID=A0AA39IYB1_9AGAR|nr:hypothetical protein EV421DRAFT_1742112 [Armillaria borealis]
MPDAKDDSSGTGERLTISLKARHPIPDGHDGQGDDDAESELSMPEMMGDDEFAIPDKSEESNASQSELRSSTGPKLNRWASECIAATSQNSKAKATPSPSPSPSKGNKSMRQRTSNMAKPRIPPPNVIPSSLHSEFLNEFGYDIDVLESEDFVVEGEARMNQVMIGKLVEMGARSYETVHGVQQNNNQMMATLTRDLTSLKGQVAAQDSKIKKHMEAQKRTTTMIKELQDKVSCLGRQAAEVDAWGSDEEKNEMEGVLAVIRVELQGVQKLAQDAIAGLEKTFLRMFVFTRMATLERTVDHDDGRRNDYAAHDSYTRPTNSQTNNGYRQDRGSVAPPDIGNSHPTSQPPSVNGALHLLPPRVTGALNNSHGDPMQDHTTGSPTPLMASHSFKMCAPLLLRYSEARQWIWLKRLFGDQGIPHPWHMCAFQPVKWWNGFIINELVTPTHETKVTIQSWNINGDFVAKMICPKFQRLLACYDINFFQETHLRPDQHLTIPLPLNYKILSCARPPSLTFDDPWGSVAIVISHHIQYQVREEFSGPNFLVIQVGKCLLYCTYLLPESSDWSMSTLTDDPCDCLAASLARARQVGFNVIILGDLNAHTGNRHVSPNHPVRISVDKKVSMRGHWLLQLLKDTDIVLLNGIVPLSPSSA